MLRLLKSKTFGTLARSFAAGIVFMAGMAVAAPIALFTGPTGGNPTADFPPAVATLNQLIGEINAQTGNFFSFNTTGQPVFANTGSVAANGSVATTVTSLGPTGSHTTIQEWLVWVDPAGNVRYTPGY